MIDQKIKLSPYAIFHQAMRGVDVYSRKTGNKIYKFELWNMVAQFPEDRHLVLEMRHPDFIFQKRKVVKDA